MSSSNIYSTKSTGIPSQVSEYYTYYPTQWFNGVNNTTTGLLNAGVYGGAELNGLNCAPVRSVEDVVISGVAGRFDGTDDVEVLAQEMLNGEWQQKQTGKWRSARFNQSPIFESKLFGIAQQQLINMDARLKSLVEVTYETLFDAGIHFDELKGLRTGVFIGVSPVNGVDCEYEQQPRSKLNGGEYKTLAQTLASLFEFKGPVEVLNTTCSSSLVALDAAVNAIRSGVCDYAIVAGINGEFNGKTVSVVKTGEEQLSTPLVGAVLLQKKLSCKRFYAKVLDSRVGAGIESLPSSLLYVPRQEKRGVYSEEIQSRLLKEIYAQNDIDPSVVAYIELHGANKRCGGQQERFEQNVNGLNVISDVFASPRVQRTVPLFIGSTHLPLNRQHQQNEQTEETGIFSLIKMLISIERGIIPANMQYQEPAIVDERIKMINEKTKFNGGLMALNSFCSNGSNIHILLQPNSQYLTRFGGKSFWNAQELEQIAAKPRLFTFCATTEQGLERIMNEIKKTPTDLATHFLLHPHSAASPSTHPFRGYTVLNAQRKIEEIKEIIKSELFEQQQQQWRNAAQPTTKPIWLIFNGMMNIDWQSKCKEMMHVETFRQSIIKSAEFLRPYGLNLIDLILNNRSIPVYEQTQFLNKMVGINAFQIALIDCLRQAGILENGMVGHGITGELGCAYADNCLTVEQTLLCAFQIGKWVEESAELQSTGCMAIVDGLTWEQCKQRCPIGVVPACHNGPKNVMVSGPRRQVQLFVEELKSQGVYAKVIEGTCAFHSYHVASNIASLKIALEKVIRSPKQRSPKWISTSVQDQKWDNELSRFLSADYLVNNLIAPVMFYEAVRYVPDNAIAIEIGQNDLLNETFYLPKQRLVVVPLINKYYNEYSQQQKYTNQLEHFLAQLGRVYNEGINVDACKLYLPIESEQSIYPVPVGTGFMTRFAKWMSYKQQQQQLEEDDEEESTYPVEQQFLNKCKGKFVYKIDLLNNEDDLFLTQQQQQQQQVRSVNPVSGYLHLVWKSLAKLNGQEEVDRFPVVFENVEIHQSYTPVNKNKVTRFTVTIVPSTGLFELIEGVNGKVVLTGRVYPVEAKYNFVNQQQQTTPYGLQSKLNAAKWIEQEQEQNYNGEFRPIIKADLEGTRGDLLLNNKWVAFLDDLIEVNNLVVRPFQQQLPIRIKSLEVFPTKSQNLSKQYQNDKSNETLTYIIENCIKNQIQQQKNVTSFDELLYTTVDGLNKLRCDESRVYQQDTSLFNIIDNILNQKQQQQQQQQLNKDDIALDSILRMDYKQLLNQYAPYPIVNDTEEIETIPLFKVQGTVKTIRPSQSLNGLKKINYLMPIRPVEKLNDIEFVQQTPVFAIHPIEGHVNMLKSWAKQIKYPVYGVQYTKEAMQYETIEKLAEYYWQQIDQQLNGQQQAQRVHLCGYAFGAQVAFEMAARRPNRIASLTFLDGSVFPINRLNNQVDTEVEALYKFAQQYLPTLCKREFFQELAQRASFEQRIRYVVRELIAKSQFQFEPIDLDQAARAFVIKSIMSSRYQPRQPLRLNEILLVKCGQREQLNEVRQEEEERLAQLFNGKIQVQLVDTDYRSLLEGFNGQRVASIVNDYLHIVNDYILF